MDAQNSQILIDSDVISHFITNNCLKDLPGILYPYKCLVLDIVYYEITRNHPLSVSS